MVLVTVLSVPTVRYLSLLDSPLQQSDRILFQDITSLKIRPSANVAGTHDT